MLEKQAGKNKIENGPTSKGGSGKKNQVLDIYLVNVSWFLIQWIVLNFSLQYQIYLLSNQ